MATPDTSPNVTPTVGASGLSESDPMANYDKNFPPLRSRTTLERDRMAGDAASDVPIASYGPTGDDGDVRMVCTPTQPETAVNNPILEALGTLSSTNATALWAQEAIDSLQAETLEAIDAIGQSGVSARLMRTTATRRDVAGMSADVRTLT